MKFRLIWLAPLFSTFLPSRGQVPQAPAPLTPEQRDAEIRLLHQELDQISARLAALESSRPAAIPAPAAAPVPLSTSSAPAPLAQAASTPTGGSSASDIPGLSGTVFGFGVDGYYEYNFNQPVGRVNLLRAYDVTSNSFNLNQLSLIVEHDPTAAERVGGRFDLQFGQATETLQGSSANEQRPQVWRNVFQAYGSYLAPIGSGLHLDFGKFASALGNEGNYTKDQIAYSRSFSFNYLPFYHMGLRANYDLNSKVNVAYWLVNGANDTEDLNGFKSQAFLFTVKPAASLTWNANYYFGQEARDVQPAVNPGLPSGPIQPGLPTANIFPVPNGREHIFDTYVNWNATPKLLLVGEGDYIINRTYAEQRPLRVAIGSLTARYSLSHSANLAARFEYFNDRGGLFSGKTQALKEITLVADRTLSSYFLIRAEYRRDFSNQAFFLSDTAGALEKAQSTAGVGLVYWWGNKQGSW